MTKKDTELLERIAYAVEQLANVPRGGDRHFAFEVFSVEPKTKISMFDVHGKTLEEATENARTLYAEKSGKDKDEFTVQLFAEI